MPVTTPPFDPASGFDSESGIDHQHATGQETRVTDHVAQAARTTLEKAVGNLAQAERVVRDAQSAASIKISDISSEARQIGRESISTLQNYIDEKPFKAVGIAFAAGYLFSAVLRK